MRMEDSPFDRLRDEQRKALNRLLPLLGPEGVDNLALQGPDAVKARLRVFSEYENALYEHIHARMPSPAPPVTPAAAHEVVYRPRPLLANVQTFKGKEGDNLVLWIREI